MTKSSSKKLIIVTAEGCPGCKEIKDIVKGKIRIIDYLEHRKEAESLMEKAKSSVVPSAIQVNGDQHEKCKILTSGDSIEILCKENRYLFKK